MSKLIKGPPGSLRRKTVEKVERVDRDDDEDLMEVADEDDEEVKASFEEQVRGRVFQLNAAFLMPTSFSHGLKAPNCFGFITKNCSTNKHKTLTHSPVPCELCRYINLFLIDLIDIVCVLNRRNKGVVQQYF
jgi:hypothetical protein